MRLIALCGAAGAGKDTVADMLPARKLAFADTLYAEVAAAFGTTVKWLKDRNRKDVPQLDLALRHCWDSDFVEYLHESFGPRGPLAYQTSRSPRQILQWWGDYQRAQSPDYFVARAWQAICEHMMRDESVVLTDARFPNEAAVVRQLGGQIWQIRRPGYEAGGTGHASDTAGDEFAPDRVIRNEGEMEDLRAVVLAAWGAYDCSRNV